MEEAIQGALSPHPSANLGRNPCIPRGLGHQGRQVTLTLCSLVISIFNITPSVLLQPRRASSQNNWPRPTTNGSGHQLHPTGATSESVIVLEKQQQCQPPHPRPRRPPTGRRPNTRPTPRPCRRQPTTHDTPTISRASIQHPTWPPAARPIPHSAARPETGSPAGETRTSPTTARTAAWSVTAEGPVGVPRSSGLAGMFLFLFLYHSYLSLSVAFLVSLHPSTCCLYNNPGPGIGDRPRAVTRRLPSPHRNTHSHHSSTHLMSHPKY